MENHGGSGVGGVERRDGENTVFQLRVEEARFGADVFALTGEERILGLLVGGEVGDVVEHPAEFLVELVVREFAFGNGITVFEESEAGGEFAVAEARLMEALAGAGAAVEHVEVFAFAVLGGEFGTVFLEAEIEDPEVGFDDVGDIAQEGGGALLAGIFDENADGGDGLSFHGGCGGGTGLGSDFVAADIGEADGFEDVDAVDDPADLGLPVDGLQNAAGGGGGDDVVGDALDLHLRPGEAGEGAADVEFDAVGHDFKLLAF